jgi:hypothetical protein
LGHIKNLFKAVKIPPRNVTPTGIWGDVCENIHLHFRNLRLEFSEKEWANFRAAVHFIGMGVEKCLADDYPDWEEGDPNFLVQIMHNESFKPHSKHHPNRLTVEEQRDGTFHIHYRDLRLHLSHTEFCEFADGMRTAINHIEADDIPEFPYKDTIKPTYKLVDINLVQPYDAGHLPLEEDMEHREGIEYAKGLLKEGKPLRAILVDEEGQRLDGYKRYMAQKEMGKTHIVVRIDPNAPMGGQHGMSMLAIDDHEDDVTDVSRETEEE